eukprot:1322849-Pyramimonas_sp.AAC.1
MHSATPYRGRPIRRKSGQLRAELKGRLDTAGLIVGTMGSVLRHRMGCPRKCARNLRRDMHYPGGRLALLYLCLDMGGGSLLASHPYLHGRFVSTGHGL